jgi:polyhydroxybutyrate depolymerase
MEFTVDGAARTALVYAPASAHTEAAPLVFVFHGHGGGARQAERSFGMDRNWPEAISVYMQGLATPGQLTDPQGNQPGWQARLGAEGDRDLKFFDAVLARVRSDYRVDNRRVYATGHSNGGGFTYLLWLARGDTFAAMAPSSAVATYVNQLKPKPVMHIAGQHDPLVKFAWQQMMMDALRRINGCDATGGVWEGSGTIYPSKTGTPVVTLVHPGGHELSPEAPALIVKFFKQHPGPATAP